MKNDGAGGFRDGGTYPAGNNSNGIVVADFNRDGKPDLATANWLGDDVSVLIGDGAGGFRPAVHYAGGPHPGALASADVDGDGDADLLWGNGEASFFSVAANREAVHTPIVQEVKNGQFAVFKA